MGYGNYSHAAHTALIADRAAKSGSEVFTQTATHPLMNPHGLKAVSYTHLTLPTNREV